MRRLELLHWLRETNPHPLEELWREADAARAEHVGTEVHLRALIEASSHCVRHCHYCGLRADNHALPRYRMTGQEILECAMRAADLGMGTVVLQAGEDPGLTRRDMIGVIRRIKRETDLAVTLSLGERDPDELAAWREAGADRYLLRFETSNARLYRRLHPGRPGTGNHRIAILHRLRALGYEVGSGVMVGLPGQTFDDLAGDLMLFRELDLDMIGVGPFIPHPCTPLGTWNTENGHGPDQPPNDAITTCKVVALARLTCPDANIPSTTALASLDPVGGHELALQRGANVIMPNFTPPHYRALYDVYPGKRCVCDEAETRLGEFRRRIASLGRVVGTGRGDSPRFRARGMGDARLKKGTVT